MKESESISYYCSKTLKLS